MHPLLFSLVLLLVSPLRAEPATVAVASNFIHTARALNRLFHQQAGTRVRLVAGSSGKHFAQIRHGAPFHAFLSADDQRPIRLEQQGRAVAGSRFTYALGQLVLWQPKAEQTGPGALRQNGFGRLALANPRLAPYGAAARDWLSRQHLWQPLQQQGRLVLGENIAQAFQFVYTGHAQAGLVAAAQLLRLPEAQRGAVYPIHDHTPIRQQAILLRQHPDAEAFLDFLRSTRARALIRQHGYRLP